MQTVLVRYGTIPEVARFSVDSPEPIARNTRVVVRSQRGTEIGSLLEDYKPRPNGTSADEPGLLILRVATPEDESTNTELRSECETEFELWQKRIADWKLDLELIDLERTLDRDKLVLYVLNQAGPDCTKLALYVAAEGLGNVEVQPVGLDGLISLPHGGGCGSGGCGSCG